MMTSKTPGHLPECGTQYRGCAPDCPKEKWEQEHELRFVILHKAWYHQKGDMPQIMIGGFGWEMSFEWTEITHGKVAAKFHAFDDSWMGLSELVDIGLFARMTEFRDYYGVEPEDIIKMLASLGFRDNTPYISPYTPDQERLALEKIAIERRLKEIETKLNQE